MTTSESTENSTKNPLLSDCPSCKKSWRGKDILASILSLNVFLGRNVKDVGKLAAAYGYTQENPRPFSEVIVIFVPETNKTFLQCPFCFMVHKDDLSESSPDLQKFIANGEH